MSDLINDLIERLRDKARLRAAHGLTGWVLAEEALLAQAADEIERLTAALRAQPGPVNMDDVEWAGKAHLAEAIRERDEHARWRADLADKLHDRETTISAAWEALRSAGVHSEATIDDGIRLLRRQLAEAEMDAERYRWLRNEANTARKCDPMVCIYPLDEQDLIDGDRLDIAIDAAMGASNE